MKAVIQRVSYANVIIDGEIHNEIGKGLVVLIGIEDADLQEDIDWLAGKVTGLRIFNDDAGIMNLNVTDISGEIMVISQFTLQARIKKGNRPSYINAAKPDIAIPLYEKFVASISTLVNTEIKTGVFGADMKIEMENDGPVTIVIDTKNRI